MERETDEYLPNENSEPSEDAEIETDEEGRKRTKKRREIRNETLSPSDRHTTPKASDAEKPRVNKRAVRKRIRAEGDSDDEIIWDMKSAGHPDVEIRDRLISEGRTPYSVGTISTRYHKIRKAKSANLQRSLENDFEDYSVEDDDTLRAALAETQQQYNKQTEQLGSQRWKQIAYSMNAKLPEPKFTPRLVEERWQAIKNESGFAQLEQGTSREARSARSEADKALRRRERELVKAAKEAEKEVAAAKRQEKKEALAKARDAEMDRKGAVKKQRAEDRQRLQEEKSAIKAQKAWKRRVDAQERHKRAQEDKMVRDQAKAAKRAQAIQAEIDKANRTEIIRRWMRAHGAIIAAPAPTPSRCEEQQHLQQDSPLSYEV